MANYPQGSIAELRVTFLDRPNGVPVDPTVISLSIYNDVSALVAGPFTYPAQVHRELAGLYGYDWSVPEDLALGEYTAEWRATISGSVRTGYELFSVTEGAVVTPGQPLAWATTEDVERITGVVVSSAVVSQAQAAIEVHSGRTYAARDRTGTRDQGWLKYAVAYQAAWLPSQPDYAQRMDLTGVTGPGAATGTVPLTSTGMVLAPMARWALKRVSWLKSRSLHVRSPFVDDSGSGRFLNEADDDLFRWAPIGGR